jgi:hypothetical protein
MLEYVQRLVVLALWSVAAATATAVGIGAVSVIGDGLTTDPVNPLSRSAVDRALDRGKSPGRQASLASRNVSDTKVTAKSKQGIIRAFSTSGGTALAECIDDSASLKSWTPAQGYATDKVEPGPTREALVEFESDDDDAETELRISCRNGTPKIVTESSGDEGSDGEGESSGDEDDD